MPTTSVFESQRRLSASKIYSQPLKPWETRVLRLQPADHEHDDAGIVEVHLETAVIPHSEGLGLVDTGEVIFYDALSYTWDSNVFSHTIQCNGHEFSVTANLHAALVHLRSSRAHRWLWIDALCINQYDNPEKEHQVRNMFHIYRKASTVIVWLGPAGPGTSLGADIVNVYDKIWQEWRRVNFRYDVGSTLRQRAWRNSDTKIHVDEFLNEIQENQSSDDDLRGIDTLGLLSMALDGVLDISGRAWLRRTWIIQEFAAASDIEFHCGRSILSYDAFYSVIPEIGLLLWSTREVYLAGGEDMIYAKRLDSRDLLASQPATYLFGDETLDDGPVSLKDLSAFTGVLHQIRLLVNDPACQIQSRCTQMELLLVFLVGTVFRGFDVSLEVDRVYSLIAMTDAISDASWGLTHNKRTASSPQQLPVDYSVDLWNAVLRTLKIRMNEIKHFYVAIQDLFWLDEHDILESTDRDVKLVLFSLCTADGSKPSWLTLLEFTDANLRGYLHRVGNEQKRGYLNPWYWVEQNLTEPEILVLRGKEVGRLVVDSEEHPSKIWAELPCPLGQELETISEHQKPVRALHEGCPDQRVAAGEEASLDDAETDAGIGFWKWEFPSSARDGDLIVVLYSTCALVRPLPGGKYKIVKDGLRKPVGSILNFDYQLESDFLLKHSEDLDTFVLI